MFHCSCLLFHQEIRARSRASKAVLSSPFPKNSFYTDHSKAVSVLRATVVCFVLSLFVPQSFSVSGRLWVVIVAFPEYLRLYVC